MAAIINVVVSDGWVVTPYAPDPRVSLEETISAM